MAPSDLESLSASLGGVCTAVKGIIPIISFMMIAASGPFIVIALGSYFLYKGSKEPKNQGLRMAAIIAGAIGGLLLLGAMFGIAIVIVTPEILSAFYGPEAVANC